MARVPLEAEIGVTHLQAKEHQKWPAIPEAKRKAWDRFSPTAFRGDVAHLAPLPASKTVTE